jgi:hypothetical protein
MVQRRTRAGGGRRERNFSHPHVGNTVQLARRILVVGAHLAQAAFEESPLALV